MGEGMSASEGGAVLVYELGPDFSFNGLSFWAGSPKMELDSCVS